MIPCVCQDKNSRMTIGNARMINGRYYFKKNLSSGKSAQEFRSIYSMSIDEQIMVWHYKLGHPSFIYLKQLLPIMFKNKDRLKFKCESCLLAKSRRQSNVPRPYLPSKPFYLLHNDVWGPSK